MVGDIWPVIDLAPPSSGMNMSANPNLTWRLAGSQICSRMVCRCRLPQVQEYLTLRSFRRKVSGLKDDFHHQRYHYLPQTKCETLQPLYLLNDLDWHSVGDPLAHKSSNTVLLQARACLPTSSFLEYGIGCLLAVVRGQRACLWDSSHLRSLL